MEVSAAFYLMLIKGSEVLKGLAVNTTNSKSPGSPHPRPPPYIPPDALMEMLFKRSVVKTPARVGSQRSPKKRPNETGNQSH